MSDSNVSIEQWKIIRSTLTSGRPTASRALWGIVKRDPSGFYLPGETLLRGGLTSLENGIAETFSGERFRLEGQGREIQVPLKMMPQIHLMTGEDWSEFIQKEIEII